MNDMPPDPFPTVHPHTLGHFEIVPDEASYGIRMKVLVRCLDCGDGLIGEARCQHEAVQLMYDHAVEMNA